MPTHRGCPRPHCLLTALLAFVLFAGMGVGTALEGSLSAAGGYVVSLLASAGAAVLFGIWLALALGSVRHKVR